jgi:hypothetical protein
MKLIKKLIKPLTRVVVAILASIGALGVIGLAIAARKPEWQRTAGEQETVNNLKNLVTH